MSYREIQQLAGNYFNQGQYSQFIELDEQCIEFQPDEVNHYLYLGLAYFLQGDELEADTVWMSVIFQQNLEESQKVIV